jgi:hypothetical protein
LGQFAVKHHVGVDWLISGDLKGRLRMARNKVALPNAGERMRTPVPEAVRKVVEALDEKEGSAVIRPLGDGCPRNKPEPWRTETSVNLRTSFRRETPIGGTGCTKFSARFRAVLAHTGARKMRRTHCRGRLELRNMRHLPLMIMGAALLMALPCPAFARGGGGHGLGMHGFGSHGFAGRSESGGQFAGDRRHANDAYANAASQEVDKLLDQKLKSICRGC